ncbi:hypothetical protein Pfo_007135 [Paulownia fortunei]|nr:hypothetical protein Pfo_007135 [Paulownia fortunei]
MEKWVLLFLALLNLKAFAQDQQDSWIRIDCGANRSTPTNGVLWQIDEAFIKTGTNHLIPNDRVKPLSYLNTLRAFTEQNKNCYTLPALAMNRYFIRAVFFYANYDGLSNPPSFDLQIDGNKVVTVVSSSTEVRYYEILYWCQRSSISVCLARTQSDQFPFISSLEAWSIPDTMYARMSQDLAWLNSYRYNYGTDVGITGYPGDSYNRIWEPMSAPGAVNTSADPGTTIIAFSDEYPPESAILDAIEAQDETTSLFLSFSPVKTITPIYVEAYFTEMQVMFTDTRSFDMYVDGKNLVTVIPEYYTCTPELALVQALTSNLTIELRPTATTSLPPIISAIEIYTASDPLITTGTHQNDLNGLAAFTNTFDQLKGWSGEPCLPEDTVWQWLGCKGSDPPRVTSLNLSGYNLNGTLPNFSQMQALEDIDLSNNSLSGQIPGFLGQLPNLKKLNLSYNGFSGTLPSSIRDNRRLIYEINGNPNVDASGKDKSSKASIIGLAVGIPLVVIVLILALIFWLIRKRANQEEDDEDCIPVNVVYMKPNQQSMIPEMDLDELEELIDQHANAGSDENYHAELTSDEDCVAVGEYGANAQSNDQSMVPDLDLEELDEIIRHEKERADELAGHRSDN